MFDLCAICWTEQRIVRRLSDILETTKMNYYEQLTACIPEMRFKELSDQRLICAECCDCLDVVYKFREKCLRSKTILINHISHLHSDSNSTQDDSSNIQEILIKTEIYDSGDENCDFEQENNKIRFENGSDDVVKISFQPEYENDRNLEGNVSFSCTNVSHVRKEKDASTSNKEPDNWRMLNKRLKSEIFDPNSDEKSLNESCKNIVEKKYRCDVCKKAFAKIDYLQIHRRIHTGIKPFQCDLCDKKFSQSSSLTKHRRIHTGERPYKCNVCTKKFNQTAHLKVHMRAHTGEKPYACNICQKRFSQKGDLQRHGKQHP